MSERARTISIWDPGIVRQAIVDSFRKLDPRIQIKNPVMFIVEVGSLLTTIVFVQELAGGDRPAAVHRPGRVLAVVHGAVRELRRGDGRGPRQGAGRHAAEDADRDGREPARGRRPHRDRCRRRACARATSSWSRPASSFPADGEIIEGVASVDESAITGESAPVIRESGGDRSAVTGGTRVISDWIKVRVTSDPGHTFLDRMIALVEGAERQKTPNEIALNILLAVLTLVFLLVVVTLQPFAYYAGTRDSDSGADLAAGVPDSDDDRRADLGDRHRRHGPPGAAQRAGDVGPRGRSGRRRAHAAARQDRHDHARQPPGDRVHAGARRHRGASWPTRRSWRRWPTRRPRGARSSCWPRRSTASAAASWPTRTPTFVPFTAQTRMSGVNLDGREIRKGAADAIADVRDRQRRHRRRRAAGDRRAHRARRRHAAGRRRAHARARRRSTSRTSSRAACASASTRCARWASGRS